MKESITKLSKNLEKYSWFHSVQEESNSVVVYTYLMSGEVFNVVPSVVDGLNVKVAFAAYLNCAKKYADPVFLEDLMKAEENTTKLMH